MLKFEDFHSDFKKNGGVKYCFHHNKIECNQKIKRAHSIQQNKVLSQLEEDIGGNQMFYSFNSFSTDDNMKTDLIPVGKKRASIFTGFCDYHDSKLFSPLENHDFKNTTEQLFLISYRTFAHGFHQLIEQNKYYQRDDTLMEHFPEWYKIDYRRYFKRNLDQAQPYKEILDRLIEEKNYTNLNYHVREMKPFVPIACSSILSPLYSYNNKPLYPNKISSFLMLNILPDFDRTYIILSSFNEDDMGNILFDELIELTDLELQQAISSLLIYCTTNTFFSAKIWNKFTDKMKKQFFDECTFCVKYGGRMKNFFHSKLNFFAI